MFKSKSTIFAVLVVIAVFAIFGYRYYVNNLQQNEQVSTAVNPANPNSISNVDNTPEELKILKVKLENISQGNSFVKNENPIPDVINIRKFNKSEVYFCQPDDFDPSKTQYEKVVNQAIIPSEFYEITNPSDPDKTVFQIDGWNKEGEDKVSLNNPLELTQYKFGCSSQFDSVLSLKKDGKIFKTFKNVISNVYQKAVSEDKKFLFLENYETEGMDLVFKTRIYDLENDKMIEIPQIDCILSLNVFWSGKRLLSTEEIEGANKICIWDQEGKLEVQLDYPLATSSGSKVSISSNLGIYGDYLSVYNLNTPQYEAYGNCILSTYNLKNGEPKEAVLIKAGSSGDCPNIEIKSITNDEVSFYFKNTDN